MTRNNLKEHLTWLYRTRANVPLPFKSINNQTTSSSSLSEISHRPINPPLKCLQNSSLDIPTTSTSCHAPDALTANGSPSKNSISTSDVKPNFLVSRSASAFAGLHCENSDLISEKASKSSSLLPSGSITKSTHINPLNSSTLAISTHQGNPNVLCRSSGRADLSPTPNIESNQILNIDSIDLTTDFQAIPHSSGSKRKSNGITSLNDSTNKRPRNICESAAQTGKSTNVQIHNDADSFVEISAILHNSPEANKNVNPTHNISGISSPNHPTFSRGTPLVCHSHDSHQQQTVPKDFDSRSAAQDDGLFVNSVPSSSQMSDVEKTLGAPKKLVSRSRAKHVIDDTDDTDFGYVSSPDKNSTNTTKLCSKISVRFKNPPFDFSNDKSQTVKTEADSTSQDIIEGKDTCPSPFFLNAILAYPDAKLRDLLEKAEIGRREIAEKAAEDIKIFSDVSHEHKLQLKARKDHKDSIAMLIDVRNICLTKTQRKSQIEATVIEAVKFGRETSWFSRYLDENFLLGKEIRELEQQLIELVEKCKIKDEFSLPPTSCTGSDVPKDRVVVFSTQNTSHSKDNVFHESSGIVGQTQLHSSHCRVAQNTTHDIQTGPSNMIGPSISECESGNSMVCRAQNDAYFDDEEPAFSNNMGTPPLQDLEEYSMSDLNEVVIGKNDFTGEQDSVKPVGSKIDVSRVPNNNVNAKDLKPNSVQHKISGTYVKDTPNSSRTSQMDFPWSDEVGRAMKEIFHLSGFRPNQLEAINSTLAGKDVFVLMPTGGGKSLCYQVPAVVTRGRTRGVTIVVSPLLSLMEDQVMHLNDNGIRAFLLTGENTASEKQMIYNKLRSAHAGSEVQLLYVTPEMLTKNKGIIELFTSLYQRNMLARIVIDEAHCVSQWGHDFRPDYKAVGTIRSLFPSVPFIALTATATMEVECDVKHNLGMEKCEIFRQSFNRPNLSYEVLKKGSAKGLIDIIATLIKDRYRGECGIIYCLSRSSCEEVAEQLTKKHKISAHHYHAGMEAQEKRMVQASWQKGRYKVIVATIAFGMGIDKADVRFVIHHTIPKSLEGYYQETGRAGRDGRKSGCYLFYSFSDFSVLSRMVERSETENRKGAKTTEEKRLLAAQKERQLRMLRAVVQFCENLRDCRRVQVLEYFGESFLPELCHKTCDNCRSGKVYEAVNLIDHAKGALGLVESIQNDRVGLSYCIDVFRGSKAAKIRQRGHDQKSGYGLGAHLDREVTERLFRKLAREGYFREVNLVNRQGFPLQYIEVTPFSREKLIRSKEFLLDMEISKGIEGEESGRLVSRTKSGNRNAIPFSTNISSPGRVGGRWEGVDSDIDDGEYLDSNGYVQDSFVVGDDEMIEYDECEELSRDNRTLRKGNLTQGNYLGKPISTDEKLSRLNRVHRDIVEGFLNAGRDMCRKILIERDLRAVPFTDTILREMAITFPRNEKEMMKIAGIDHMKVREYGRQFQGLIDHYRAHYEQAMRGNNGNGGRGEDGMDEDIPFDPNHEKVINLCSDEGEVFDVESEDYGSWIDPEEIVEQEREYMQKSIEGINQGESLVRSVYFEGLERNFSENKNDHGEIEGLDGTMASSLNTISSYSRGRGGGRNGGIGKRVKRVTRGNGGVQSSTRGMKKGGRGRGRGRGKSFKVSGTRATTTANGIDIMPT